MPVVSVERFAAAPVEDRGTPESVWRSAGSTFPELDSTACRHLVVVAPHPDDEVLGVGGLSALLAQRGVPVTVVSVTDGGASHPGSPTFGPRELERLRRIESSRALAELGIAEPLRLGYPDGDVAAYEQDLEARLAEILALHAGGGVWCATPLRTDGHPDHEAVGRATARAVAASEVELVEYPIWMWHWATPGDDAVEWERARSITLPSDVLALKTRATRHFLTQIHDLSGDPADRAVLPQWVLDRLLRPTETVFE